jgi:ribosomal protein L11 methyltransferase
MTTKIATTFDGQTGSDAQTGFNGGPGPEPRYPFVHVETDTANADALSSELFGLGATGVEERDSGTLLKANPTTSTPQNAAAQQDAVTLVASFDSHEAAQEAIDALTEEYPALPVHLEEIVGDGWRDEWKRYFEPFAITPRITIVPPWVQYSARPDEQVLELEPGRAFGTGLHPTTSLIASYLHDHGAALADVEVFDIGAGSGILAMITLLSGARQVLCVDNDPDVMGVIIENAERNHLRERIRTQVGTAANIEGTSRWVLANIETRVLLPAAADIARCVAPGGRLVLSGILEGEQDNLAQRYAELGFRQLESRQRRDDSGYAWIMLALERSV